LFSLPLLSLSSPLPHFLSPIPRLRERTPAAPRRRSPQRPIALDEERRRSVRRFFPSTAPPQRRDPYALASLVCPPPPSSLTRWAPRDRTRGAGWSSTGTGVVLRALPLPRAAMATVRRGHHSGSEVNAAGLSRAHDPCGCRCRHRKGSHHVIANPTA
jgi:hypothetical protein